MNKVWKKELKSQCLWSLYKDYSDLLECVDNVKFVESFQHMDFLMSCLCQSENLIPFCFAVGNFDCCMVKGESKFETSLVDAKPFVDIVNDCQINKLYCQCYLSVGRGSNMFCFGGTLLMKELPILPEFCNLKTLDPLLWMRSETNSLAFKNLIKVYNSSPFSKKSDTNYQFRSKLPSKQQFSEILHHCLSTEHQINYGFYCVRPDVKLTAESLFFGNGERYYEVHTNMIRQMAPKSVILQALQSLQSLDKHRINKITIRSLNKRDLKILSKLFEGKTDICSILDHHSLNYRLLIILKDLAIERFIDGTRIDDFMVNVATFYQLLKNQLLQDKLFLDQYQTLLVFRSIPSFISSTTQLYLFATWDASYTLNLSLQCDNVIKVNHIDHKHQSEILECQQILLELTNENVETNRSVFKGCRGCCIIHDDLVFSFDCCGRMFCQNVTNNDSKSQPINSVHPDDLKFLMTQQIKNMIKYHQEKCHLINQQNQMNQAIVNLKFIHTIIKTQMMSHQRLKITEHLYANLYFGIQKN